MSWANKLLFVDRRIIFGLVFLGAILPIIKPIGFVVTISPPVQRVFDRIEEMQPGDAVLMSFDYGPSDGPELDPMANSILRHCYFRGVKVLGLALFPLGGVDMAIARTRQLVDDVEAVDGVHWVNLGYKDGAQAPMKAMGENIADVFPTDANGVPYDQVPMLKGIRNYNNIEMAVTLCTSILGEWWINLVNAQFGIDVVVGTTAVSAPKYYAYMEAKQALGVIGGMKGASEYEELVARHYPQAEGLSRSATMGMDVQSIVHVIIIFFILFGNVMFLILRKKETK
jgi:hypothetical protein